VRSQLALLGLLIEFFSPSSPSPITGHVGARLLLSFGSSEAVIEATFVSQSVLCWGHEKTLLIFAQEKPSNINLDIAER
jgi:hypothetical protein